MLGKDYEGQVCSIARALEVVGERWTLLVVRDVANGVSRFDDLVESVGVTRSVLTARLRHLEAEGVVARHRYQDRPERFEYRLTGKGAGLLPVLAHLLWWGDEHYPSPGGPPRVLVHADCGGAVTSDHRCAGCGRPLAVSDVVSLPGPRS